MVELPPDWIETFQFQRMDRPDFVLDCLDPSAPNQIVEKLSLAITEEYRARRTLPKLHPQFVSPLTWLKPLCYNAILSCLHHDLFDQFEARNALYGRFKRGPTVDRSIFMTGLVGIFAHDLPVLQLTDNKKVLSDTLTSEKERERLVAAMWWGFRHYITPGELNAFNRKYPLHTADSKLPLTYIVPELYNSVIARRALGEEFNGFIDHERGRYPDEIEQAVNALLDKREQARRQRPARPDPNWD